MFLHRNHGCIVSLRTLKRKIKRIGLRRRMPDYEMDAVRASVEGSGGSRQKFEWVPLWAWSHIFLATPLTFVKNWATPIFAF